MREEEPRIDEWWKELERLSRGLGRIGPDDVCCEGLTARQCGLLRRLAQGEGMVLGELAQRAGITSSALSRALDRLEEAKLVARVWGAGKDGRAAVVQLTGAGKEVLERINRLMLARTQAVVESIPESTRPLVWRALMHLNHAVEAAGGEVLVGDRCGCDAADPAVTNKESRDE